VGLACPDRSIGDAMLTNYRVEGHVSSWHLCCKTE